LPVRHDETVEEVGELSRRRADRLTKAGSLHETDEEGDYN
jgi:hypothetical protein